MGLKEESTYMQDYMEEERIVENEGAKGDVEDELGKELVECPN